MTSRPDEQPRPRIVAHRGASFDAPENTLAAFRLAWEQGADGIEADFRLTSDERVVSIHDDDMKRVAGICRSVKDSTYDDLQSLDVGVWKGERWREERIPSIEDVIAIVPAGRMIFIELKTGPEIVAPVSRILSSAGLAADQVVIISLDENVVAACKKQMPSVKCHWLAAYEQKPSGEWLPTVGEVIETIRRSGADGFGSEARPECLNAQFVRGLRAAGIGEFHVWTVDDLERARYFQRLGAWSITTNRPAALRALL